MSEDDIFDLEKPKASSLKKTKKTHPWRQARLSPAHATNELEASLLMELVLECHGNVTNIHEELKRRGYNVPYTTLKRRLRRPDILGTIEEARQAAESRIYEKLEVLAEGAKVTLPTGEEVIAPPDRGAIIEILRALDPETWDPKVRAMKWERAQEEAKKSQNKKVVFEVRARPEHGNDNN